MGIPVLETERLRLTVPRETDARALHAYALRNQEHLAPWSPPAPPDWSTWSNARRRARDYQNQAGQGTCFRFWARPREQPDGEFIGAITISQIVLGPRRACFLGYHVDFALQGQGYTGEGARAVLAFAFDTLLLHRVEATYVPHNERSARVLQRLGFEVEGLAKRYLFVGGRFQDHVLTALVNDKLGDIQGLCTPKAVPDQL